MPTCGHRVMFVITDAVARPTVRGTRRYTHTRTHLMRVRVCVWVRIGRRLLPNQIAPRVCGHMRVGHRVALIERRSTNGTSPAGGDGAR